MTNLAALPYTNKLFLLRRGQARPYCVAVSEPQSFIHLNHRLSLQVSSHTRNIKEHLCQVNRAVMRENISMSKNVSICVISCGQHCRCSSNPAITNTAQRHKMEAKVTTKSTLTSSV
ncbi:hypothetical protein PoB_007116200 [Plakobranchus ocellatus]|uniref:Uncharacterized protein n=1 Tax=Plakobranchus ocellatus TaxID=259542 RepID=A0AAV4DK51_9GAST|nr:hypothetical protein PoB_007116200 [Plakobranchus ocellatus]